MIHVLVHKNFWGMGVPAGETRSSTSHKERGETPPFCTALNPTKNYSLHTLQHLFVHFRSSLGTWEQMAEHFFTPLNRTQQF